jgi:hypothetical protein
MNFSIGMNTSVMFVVARSQSMCGIMQSVGRCGLDASLISMLVTPVVGFTSNSMSCCSTSTLTPFSASSLGSAR